MLHTSCSVPDKGRSVHSRSNGDAHPSSGTRFPTPDSLEKSDSAELHLPQKGAQRLSQPTKISHLHSCVVAEESDELESCLRCTRFGLSSISPCYRISLIQSTVWDALQRPANYGCQVRSHARALRGKHFGRVASQSICTHGVHAPAMRDYQC